MTKRTLPNRTRPCVQALEKRTLLATGIGIFTPGTSTWALRSTASPGDTDLGTFSFGLGTPVVGDWNGDGVDDIGTFDPKTALWQLHYGASEGLPDAGVFTF